MKTTLRLLLPLIGLTLCGASVQAATNYWDINGATTGSGGANPSGTWDVGATANWSADAIGLSATTVWANGDDAIFSAGADATGAFNVDLSGSPVVGNITVQEGAVTISGGTELNVGGGVTALGIIDVLSGATLTINSTVTGGDVSGSVTKGITGGNGTGTLVLTGANTYTGQTTARVGWLVFDSVGNVNGGPSALGNPANSTVGQIKLGGGSVAGYLKYIGPGHSTDRIINISTGTGSTIIEASGSGPIAFTNPTDGIIIGATGQKFIVFAGTNKGLNTIVGVIPNSSNGQYTRVEKTNGGTWVLLGVNTFTGVFDIRDGTVVVNSVADKGQPSSLGLGNAGNSHDIIGLGAFGSTNSTLKYIGPGHMTTRPFRMWGNNTNGGGIVDASGTGPLLLYGDITRPPTDTREKTFTLTGTNTDTNTLGGIILDSASFMKTHVRKDGPGKWVLKGANSYTGNTIVDAGTLLVDGSINPGSAVSVRSGAILGGGGLISGPVTVDQGATLSPGRSVGTLVMDGDLTIAGNLLIEVDKSLSPANDKVIVAGVLTNAGTGTVTVSNLGAALAPGDSFAIFNKALSNGLALTITSPNVVWTNKLAEDGTIAVVSVGSEPPPPVPATNVTITAVGPNSWLVGGLGATNSAYDVYASTNIGLPMSNWWKIGTTNSSAGGVIQFVDPQATNDQRFYRFGQPD